MISKLPNPKAKKSKIDVKKVKFQEFKKSKKSEKAYLADDAKGASEKLMPPKIYDFGDIAEGGRLDQYWHSRKAELSKFTKAPAFDKNVQLNPEHFVGYFGLKGVEFGNWMSQEDRAQFLFGGAAALKSYADLLGIPYDNIGLNHTLTIAFGARGKGGAAAHYEPANNAINITKPYAEYGSLAHEYAHALDNAIAKRLKFGQFVSASPNNPFSTQKAIDPYKYNLGGFPALMEKIFEGLYWEGEKNTKFANDLNGTGQYWESRVEVWARTSEVFISLLAKGNNKMLLKPKYSEGVYPASALVNRIADFMRKLYTDGIRYVNGGSNSNFSVNQSSQETKKSADVKPKTDNSKPKTKKPLPKPVAEPTTENLKPVKLGNIVKGNATDIETSSETIPGHYAIMPLSMLIASHNFANFNRNSDYPEGCQEREYHSTKQLQMNVLNRAKNLKPIHLLNEDLTAESGPPIVNRDGVVLGGNSRTMILENVKENYYDNWVNYQTELDKRLSLFGFPDNAKAKITAPVLVRLVDVDMNRCRHYSHVLNTSTKNEEDASVKAMSYAKEIDEKAIGEIGEYLAESDAKSFVDILAIVSTKQKIMKVLRENGVINDTNVSKWIDNDNNFTSEAKAIIQTILVGIVLQDKQLIDSAKNYTDSITRAIPYMVRIKGLKGKWNITKNFENAIRFESRRRGSEIPKSQFLKTDDVFGNNPTEMDILAWDLLDLKPTEFKKAVKRYAEVATDQSNDDDAIFGRVELEPKKVIRDILDKKISGLNDKYYSSLQNIPAQQKPKSTLADKPKRDNSIFTKIGRALANDPLVKIIKNIGK